MAENNYFDPPDPDANQAAAGPKVSEEEYRRRAQELVKIPGGPPITKIRVTPDLGPGSYMAHPDLEDVRRQDFRDWEGGRWLDPTPFTHVMDMAWRLPPGHYLAMEPPPLGTPINDFQRAIGVAQLDRAREAMQRLREVGMARKREAEGASR